MKIAMVDPSLFTLPYDRGLIAGLESAGHQVTLHGRRPGPDDGDSDGTEPAGDFYRISGCWPLRALPGRLRLMAKGADHVLSMVRLLRQLRRSRPDVIHFQWLPLPVVDARLLRAFRAIAPLVATVHDSLPFNGDPSARLQGRKALDCYRACDRLILHTRQGVDRMSRLGIDAGRLRQLAHGPMPVPGRSGPAPDRMDGVVVFTLFGKLKPYKGIDVLLDAFGRLPAELRRQARVRIVGKPYMDLAPLHDAIRDLGLTGQVSIEPRFVRDDEIGALFAPGVVAVFPYRELEASGVLPQALSHGRPVIASAIGVFAETLTDGVHGHLVPAGDPASLAVALRHVLEDRAFAAACARGALALAAQAEGWTSIAARTAEIYQETIRERDGSDGAAAARAAPYLRPATLPGKVLPAALLAMALTATTTHAAALEADAGAGFLTTPNFLLAEPLPVIADRMPGDGLRMQPGSRNAFSLVMGSGQPGANMTTSQSIRDRFFLNYLTGNLNEAIGSPMDTGQAGNAVFAAVARHFPAGHPDDLHVMAADGMHLRAICSDHRTDCRPGHIWGAIVRLPFEWRPGTTLKVRYRSPGGDHSWAPIWMFTGQQLSPGPGGDPYCGFGGPDALYRPGPDNTNFEIDWNDNYPRTAAGVPTGRQVDFGTPDNYGTRWQVRPHAVYRANDDGWRHDQSARPEFLEAPFDWSADFHDLVGNWRGDGSHLLDLIVDGKLVATQYMEYPQGRYVDPVDGKLKTVAMHVIVGNQAVPSFSRGTVRDNDGTADGWTIVVQEVSGWIGNVADPDRLRLPPINGVH